MQTKSVTQTTSTPQAFSRRITRLIKILLVLLVAAALVGAALVLGTDRPAPLAMAPSALQADSLRITPLLDRQSNDLVYRPLFWAGRRPLEEPSREVIVEPQQTASSLQGARLLGVFSSGGQSGGILSLGNERRRVLVGDSVEGWELASINAGQAIFESAGNNAENDDNRRRVVLELERKTHE